MTVFTEYVGNPDDVLKAGRSILPRSFARDKRIASPDSAYADLYTGIRIVRCSVMVESTDKIPPR